MRCARARVFLDRRSRAFAGAIASWGRSREVFEREYLSAQIMRFGGNISRTAGFIGMERSALARTLKSLGVQSDDRIRAAND